MHLATLPCHALYHHTREKETAGQDFPMIRTYEKKGHSEIFGNIRKYLELPFFGFCSDSEIFGHIGNSCVCTAILAWHHNI